MEVRCASNPKDVKYYTTERLREEFHISKLFTAITFIWKRYQGILMLILRDFGKS